MTCQGWAPGPKGRINAQAQKCGALPEPDERFCVAHLTASGHKRCTVCGTWRAPHAESRPTGATTLLGPCRKCYPPLEGG